MLALFALILRHVCRKDEKPTAAASRIADPPTRAGVRFPGWIPAIAGMTRGGLGASVSTPAILWPLKLSSRTMSPGRSRRRQHLLDISPEALAVDGAVKDARCGDPAWAQAGPQGGDLPITARRRRQQPPPARRPTAAPRHVGGGPEPAPARAGVSSMRIGRSGSSEGGRGMNSRRFSATSARSCSAAWRLFLERDVLRLEKPPQTRRPAARAEAPAPTAAATRSRKSPEYGAGISSPNDMLRYHSRPSAPA